MTTTPGERLTPEIRALVEDLVQSASKYGSRTGSLSEIVHSEEKLFAALGAIEEDKKRLGKVICLAANEPDLENAIVDIESHCGEGYGFPDLLESLLEGRGDMWQPIETALKDVELLLGWWQMWPQPEWNQCVSMATCTRGGWHHGQATHWLPLPTPPIDTALNAEKA